MNSGSDVPGNADASRLGWMPPPRPRWVADMIGAGSALGATRLHPLDPDSLVADAIEATGLANFGGRADFGATTWRDGFDRLCAALQDEARLHSVGAALTRLELLRTLTNRLRIVAAEARDGGGGDAVATAIVAPWFVTGTARSGTSILHELLALDAAHRAPRAWEVMDSVPAPRSGARRDRAELARVARVDHEVRLWDAIAPEYLTMHENGAELPQECIFITAHEFMSDHWSGVHDVPGYNRWLVRADKRPAYEWHRRHLAFLQPASPPSPPSPPESPESPESPAHWVLKAPSHLGALPALFAVYPDAWVIQTHRDPRRTIPSTINLMATLRWMRSDHVDVARLSATMANGIAMQLAGVTALRANGAVPSDRFVDVRYADLMRDPVGAIRGVYEHTGQPFSDAFARAIERYLARRPRGRHGDHRYSLADLGLDGSELRDRYAAYCDAYAVPDEE